MNFDWQQWLPFLLTAVAPVVLLWAEKKFNWHFPVLRSLLELLQKQPGPAPGPAPAPVPAPVPVPGPAPATGRPMLDALLKVLWDVLRVKLGGDPMATDWELRKAPDGAMELVLKVEAAK